MKKTFFLLFALFSLAFAKENIFWGTDSVVHINRYYVGLMNEASIPVPEFRWENNVSYRIGIETSSRMFFSKAIADSFFSRIIVTNEDSSFLGGSHLWIKKDAKHYSVCFGYFPRPASMKFRPNPVSERGHSELSFRKTVIGPELGVLIQEKRTGIMFGIYRHDPIQINIGWDISISGIHHRFAVYFSPEKDKIIGWETRKPSDRGFFYEIGFDKIPAKGFVSTSNDYEGYVTNAMGFEFISKSKNLGIHLSQVSKIKNFRGEGYFEVGFFQMIPLDKFGGKSRLEPFMRTYKDYAEWFVRWQLWID